MIDRPIVGQTGGVPVLDEATARPTHFQPIKVAAAYELVAEAIEEQIIAGRLKAGDEIGTELALSRELGVNRSTVREGIRVLEQGGLIERGEGRRLRVCEPQSAGLSTRLSRSLILRKVTFRELFETAMVLELGAVEEATRRADAGDLARLDANQRQLEAARRDPAGLAEADSAFHALIAEIARNRVLQLAREPAALLFFPTTERVCHAVEEAAGRMIEAHARIIEAIRTRDTETASLWMRRHVKDWRRGFERAGHDVDAPVPANAERLAGQGR